MRHGTQYGYRKGCRCDECVAAKRAEYQRNRAAYIARAKASAEASPDGRRSYMAAYYVANSGRIKTQASAWASENRERSREIKRRYQQRNPDVQLASVNRRRARKLKATIVEFTADQLAHRLSMFAGCWICGGPKDEVDHVKPLAAGGAHCLSNLRPICVPCNRRKSSRWPFAA